MAPGAGLTVAIFQHSRQMVLEVTVSKRLSAPYRSGPSQDWIKVKNLDSPAMVRHRFQYIPDGIRC